MFLTLILIILVLGAAGYFIKLRYDAVLEKIKQVNEKRKAVNHVLNERHKLIKQVLSQSKDKGLTDPALTQLKSSFQKM